MILVCLVAEDRFAGQEVEQYFVDVELECSRQVESQEIICADCFHDALNEPHSRNLPFDRLLILLLLGSGRLLHHLVLLPEHLKVAQLANTDAFGRIDLEEALKEEAQQLLLSLRFEVRLALQVLCQLVAALAATLYLVEDVDALERKIPK